MKRFTSFFAGILCFLTLMAVTERGTVSYSASFDINSCQVQNVEIGDSTYVGITIPGTTALGIAGGPSLLYQTIYLAVPSGAKDVSLENLNCVFSDAETLEHQLVPIQDYDAEQMSHITTYANPQYYSQEDPNGVTTIISNDNFHFLYNVVALHIRRLSVNSNGKSVSYLKNISFNITYNADKDRDLEKIDRQFLDQDLAIIRSLVANPEDVTDPDFGTPKLKSTTGTTISPIQTIGIRQAHGLPVYTYCIVTSRDLAPSFERLIALKEMRGISAGIVCIEDILENAYYSAGDTISNLTDDAGALRQYLMKAYENGTRYALLGGRPPIVPIRYGYGYNINPSDILTDTELALYNIPTDMYFANFETNWNKDGDDMFGEVSNDKVSFNPQIFVGRLLCDKREDIENYLDKLEIYELNPGGGDYSYLNNAFLHFSYQFFKPDNENEVCDSLAEYNTKKVFHVLDTLLPSINNLYPNVDLSLQNYLSPSPQEVIGMLNSKKYSFFDIHSHANPSGVNVTYWNGNGSYGINALDSERKYYREMDGNGLDNITNFMYPSFSYSGSCTLMPYDSPKYQNYGSYTPDYDELSWNFGQSYTMGHNYGGVAFLGNTREGFTDRGASYQRWFFDILSKETYNVLEIGVAEALSRYAGHKQYSDDLFPSTNHRQALSHNMLGDPSVQFWKQRPLTITPTVTRSTELVYNPIKVSFSALALNQMAQREAYIISVNKNRVFSKYSIGNFKSVYLPVGINGSNDAIYVVGKNTISPRLNLIIDSDALFRAKYHYCNKAYVGNFESISDISSPGEMKIGGSTYTVDAKNDVKIDNIRIMSGGELRVLTPTTCTIKNLNIQPGGKLYIQADSVSLDVSGIYNISGNIECFKYDKYRENSPIAFQPTNIGNSPAKSRATAKDYYPLVEQGKTWAYKCGDELGFVESPVIDMMLRIDEPVTIDGKEYYALRQYSRLGKGEYGEDAVIAYLREEIDKKQVWCIQRNIFLDYPRRNFYREIGEEFLLYDFLHPEDIGFPNVGVPHLFTAKDGSVRNSIPIERQMITEGIGYLGNVYSHDDENIVFPGDLFGEIEMVASIPVPFSTFYTSELYEVTEPDGTVLYCNERLKERASAEAISAAKGCDIAVNGHNVTVSSGAGSLGEITVTASGGITVRRFDVAEPEFTFNIDGYMPGIYVVKCGAAIRKIAVK